MFPLQQSVGSAFTVAEQSGRHSRPTGSTWHAISSAPGTLAAQPAQPKHTSIGDQNNAKQTHAKHTDNMWGGGVGLRGGSGRRPQTRKSSSGLCVLLVPCPTLPYLQEEVERQLNYMVIILLRLNVHKILIMLITPIVVKHLQLLP